MIDNSDKPGDYLVRIIARKHTVACFQCPTLADVDIEVSRIKAQRSQRELPTLVVQVSRITGRSKGQLLTEPVQAA